jgi:hypothetical protein
LLLIAYTKKLNYFENGLSKFQTERSLNALQKLNYSSINIITHLMFFLDEIPTAVILRKDMKALVTE